MNTLVYAYVCTVIHSHIYTERIKYVFASEAEVKVRGNVFTSN